MAESLIFDTVAEGRAHFKDLLDAADRGAPARVRRQRQGFAVVDAERLRRLLAERGPRAEVIAEADGWSVLLPGTPVAADGVTLHEAVAEAVLALREYAEDWVDRLFVAPNHAGHWGLVQLVALSDDEQLATWLGRPEPTAKP